MVAAGEDWVFVLVSVAIDFRLSFWRIMMPNFNVNVNVEASIEFEVFCVCCGAGLCRQSSTGVATVA